MDDLSLLPWAKSARYAPEPYPLLLHGIDVGVFARRLFDRLPPAVRRAAARSLNLSVARTRRLLAFVAAAHDIGKAVPAFQVRDAGVAQPLVAAGLDLSFDPDDVPSHAALSARILAGYLRELGFGRLAPALAAAAAAHHGAPPPPTGLGGPGAAGGPVWAGLQRAVLGRMGELFRPGPPGAVPPGNGANPGLVLAAGLTAVADWLASAESFLEAAVRLPRNPAAHCRAVRGLAGGVLRAAGLDGPAGCGAAPAFAAVFGFEPNPIQARALRVLGRRPPRLILIEAPTGSGKTELALYLHLLSGNRGFYLAMPTMATASAMLERAGAFLTRTGPGPKELQLQHSTAQLNRLYRELRARAVEESGLRAAHWLASPKRAMLADNGVGTVDQALLGVLRTHHHFVRLLGLSGRTVIIDELHSYDLYTFTLVARLIRWLLKLGASVIVLSATLSPGLRESLFKQVLGTAGPAAVPYPRVTFLRGGRLVSRSLGRVPDRTVAVAAAEPDVRVLAGLAKAAAARGARVGVVVNTVDRAQQVYLALGPGEPILGPAVPGLGRPVLGKRLGGGVRVYLLHSRLPAGVRTAREEAVLRLLGPGGRPPRKLIVVATQVLEQSADVDFDFLISDLAPIDLLIQRAGRLHRFPRPRPPGFETPTLAVAGLDRPAGAAEAFAGVYAPYLVLRTARVLEGRRRLTLPRETDGLLRAVYDDEAADPGLLGARKKFRAEQAVLEARARAAALDPDHHPFGLADAGYSPEEELARVLESHVPDAGALTRLGEPAVRILPLAPGESVFQDPEALLPRVVTLRGRLVAAAVAAGFPVPEAFNTNSHDIVR